MGEINKNKKLLIAAGALLLFSAAALIFYFFIFSKNNSSTSENEEDIEETLIYIDPKTPPDIKLFFSELSRNYDWKETESINNSQVKVQINPEKTTEASLDLYQVWIITKPWNRLGEYDNLEKITIGEVSKKITYEHLEDHFTIDVNKVEEDENETNNDQSSKVYKLSILHELDATEQVVGKPFENFDNYDQYLQINVEASDSLKNKIEKELDQQDFYKNKTYLLDLPTQDNFVSVIKTGTSVIGGPGWTLCERKKGLQYPVQEVEEFLKNSDLTVISNESSFVDGCTQEAGTTAFCGKPSYLQNLQSIDADIISLTGNHMCDYGRTHFESTLETYTQNNIDYFAGGNNESEAWEPLIIDTEAGKIAFVGYNKMGPNGVLATENLAGSAYYDETKFKASMDKASEKADIVWVDTHLWPEYGTTPTNDQKDHSQEAVEFGADIVTGVSSHETQSMTFFQNKPVFYGLGNFLFDQMWSTETRRGIVLKTYVYDGKIIDIKVHPTEMYDYCQPRFAEEDKKYEMLEYLVNISVFE